MTKGAYTWTCKGCLIKAGFDPDKVTESCLARLGMITCRYCGHVQDRSWFKHVCDSEVIKKLEMDKFQRDVNRGARVPNDLMGTVVVEVAQEHPPVSPSFREMVENTPLEVVKSETFKLTPREKMAKAGGEYIRRQLKKK